MNLTAEQKKAITLEKNLSVIASAGTGKTTVLTERFLHCHFNRQIPLYNLLAFTYTEKATREMKSRILSNQKIPFDEAPLLNISTIHAFCHKILKTNGAVMGLSQDFEVYEDQTHTIWQDNRIKKWVQDCLNNNDPTLTQFCKKYGLHNLVTATKLLLDEDLLSCDPGHIVSLNRENEVDQKLLTDFLKLNREFQEALIHEKIETQCLSYNDLEILTLKLLEENPYIIQKIQERYRCILVDEFQDVSPCEFALIKKIFNPELNEIFIVGDPKQSIYRFRGGNSQLFFQMTEIIQNHSGETIHLTETFRTPENLQNYFNTIFPLVLDEGCFEKAITNQDHPSQIYVGAHQKLATLEMHKEYAEQISVMIDTLIHSGASPSEIAILFYTRGHLEIYKKCLDERKINSITEMNASYFEEPLIQTTWHILNHLCDELTGHHNKISQIGILRNPIFGFSETFIDHIAKANKDNLFEEYTLDLFTSHHDREKWAFLSQKLKTWKSLSQTLLISELFQTIVHDINSTQDADQRFVTQNFLQILLSWETQDLKHLADARVLLKDLHSRELKFKSGQTDAEGVRLLTIHGAKGLEFEHVFIVPGRAKPNTSPILLLKDVEGIIFKTHEMDQENTLKYKLSESKTFEEEWQKQKTLNQSEIKRLIYVALTRAKKALYLFPAFPGKTLDESLTKDPLDVSTIKSFNDWLYWLGLQVSEAQQDWKPLPIEPISCQSSCLPPATLHLLTEESHQSLLSVTELETYVLCPKKFQLKYVQNLRVSHFATPKDETRNKTRSDLSAQEWGNLFHEILHFYQAKDEDNLDTVIDQALFNQHIIDSNHEIKSDCQEFIQKIKQNSLFQHILFDHLASHEELEFALKLENFILTGQIDKLVLVANNYTNDGLVQEKNGQPAGASSQSERKWIIVDYKTHHLSNEREKEKLAQKFHFQMSCYALAISKKFGLKEMDSLIIFTNGLTHQIFHHSERELNNFEENLNLISTQIITSLTKRKFPLTHDRNACGSCIYFKDNYCGVRSHLIP